MLIGSDEALQPRRCAAVKMKNTLTPRHSEAATVNQSACEKMMAR